MPAHAQREELTAHVAALAGWASHLRWRQRSDGDAVLVGFLAASVATEVTVVDGRAWFFADGPRPRAAALTLDPRPLVWQQAYERTVHDRLLATIEAAPEVGSTPRPAAQLVCCIDVRSEGLRRHLERTGPYETFGYAGFFGLAADTTRAQMTLAVLEGVAYAMKDAQQSLAGAGTALAEASLIGGGARSPLWAQILADVLGIPLHQVAESDIGCALGAARLARMAAGDSIAVARPATRLRSFLPRPDQVSLHGQRHARWQQLYPLASDFAHRA